MKAIPRSGAEGASSNLDRQRIDKWLWHARVARTRSSAAALASQGYVRVNGARIDAASRAVRVGDVITIALNRSVRVLQVQGFATKRGPSEVARGLYEELRPSAKQTAQMPRSLAKASFMR